MRNKQQLKDEITRLRDKNDKADTVTSFAKANAYSDCLLLIDKYLGNGI